MLSQPTKRARLLHRNTYVRELQTTHTHTDWKAQAISIYQHAQQRKFTALPFAFAEGISRLIGQPIAAESVFLDSDTGVATVVIDGMMFRTSGEDIVLVRACSECGLHIFESLALVTSIDLGYALSDWQPRCLGCQCEDPINWLEN